jgi:hypothetical protein
MEPVFRIFVDDVGHHDMKSSKDPEQRYLGLTGVVMRLDYEKGVFSESLNRIKLDAFGSTGVILHRREVMNRTPPFDVLKDGRLSQAFDAAILALIGEAQYKVFTVVIDKLEHRNRYQVWRFHPYHYCMTVLLERCVQFLRRCGQVGDVVFESRGKKENMQLEDSYKRVRKNGTDNVALKIFQERLTSNELKLRPKAANISGLQLADIIANPCWRDLICKHTKQEMTAEFSKKIMEIIRNDKYLRRSDGYIPGWGTKWLP